ncbi:GntR family transcriptional regulator [Alkalihalophilus pseudofirmus]|uniref:GntR family transcriptional regulator n=1 Tax=Alkalihalophilus pseudofirmus TaxID=79885 RepID=UPI0009F8F1FF
MVIIDRKNPLPLYVQLKEAIIEKIENREWLAGEVIPTEFELQEQYNLSRTTVRQALGDLVTSGTLTRIQGKGTFVAEPKFEPTRPGVTGFTQDMIDKGHSVSSKLLDFSMVEASDRVSRIFNIEKNTMVLKIDRLRFVDEIPIGIHEVFLNVSITPGLQLEKYNLANVSLYEALRNEGIDLGEADETVEANVADEREAELLDISTGNLVLILNRTLSLKNGKPFEYTKMVYRADKFKYSIKLR